MSHNETVCMLPIRMRVLLIQKQASISTPVLMFLLPDVITETIHYLLWGGLLFVRKMWGQCPCWSEQTVSCIGMSTRSGSPI